MLSVSGAKKRAKFKITRKGRKIRAFHFQRMELERFSSFFFENTCIMYECCFCRQECDCQEQTSGSITNKASYFLS